MRKVALSLLFLLTALCFSVQAQNEPAIHVTFILMSADLPSDTPVYITGSIEQLGTWNPGRVRMEPQGNHTWTKEISINRPLSIEYKYTLGTWEREGADANGSPLSNFVADVSQDKTVKDTVLFWTRGARQRVNHGQITGTVRYHRTLRANIVIAWQGLLLGLGIRLHTSMTSAMVGSIRSELKISLKMISDIRADRFASKASEAARLRIAADRGVTRIFSKRLAIKSTKTTKNFLRGLGVVLILSTSILMK